MTKIVTSPASLRAMTDGEEEPGSELKPLCLSLSLSYISTGSGNLSRVGVRASTNQNTPLRDSKLLKVNSHFWG